MMVVCAGARGARSPAGLWRLGHGRRHEGAKRVTYWGAVCARRTGGTAGGAAGVAEQTVVAAGVAAGVAAADTAFVAGVAETAFVAAFVAAGGAVFAAGKKATHASAHRSDGQERALRGQADQLPVQPDASCRRARPPSTSSVIAESCGASGDESCALPSGGSTQPLDVESIIARWTSIAYRRPPDTSWQAPLL